MLKKGITYTDYNGEKQTDEYYFNLSKAEIVEMQFSKEGGLSDFIKRITNAKDEGKLVELMKEMILKSYGIKSDDGKRFIKSEELSKEFSQTEAYSTLFIELATDEKAAIDFFNGIIPSELRQQDKPLLGSK